MIRLNNRRGRYTRATVVSSERTNISASFPTSTVIVKSIPRTTAAVPVIARRPSRKYLTADLNEGVSI